MLHDLVLAQQFCHQVERKDRFAGSGAAFDHDDRAVGLGAKSFPCGGQDQVECDDLVVEQRVRRFSGDHARRVFEQFLAWRVAAVRDALEDRHALSSPDAILQERAERVRIPAGEERCACYRARISFGGQDVARSVAQIVQPRTGIEIDRGGFDVEGGVRVCEIAPIVRDLDARVREFPELAAEIRQHAVVDVGGFRSGPLLEFDDHSALAAGGIFAREDRVEPRRRERKLQFECNALLAQTRVLQVRG